MNFRMKWKLTAVFKMTDLCFNLRINFISNLNLDYPNGFVSNTELICLLYIMCNFDFTTLNQRKYKNMLKKFANINLNNIVIICNYLLNVQAEQINKSTVLFQLQPRSVCKEHFLDCCYRNPFLLVGKLCCSPRFSAKVHLCPYSERS